MSWFRKKAAIPPESLAISPPAESRVEVELHKSASIDAVNKAKETNKHLNDLLVENGFTLKIYLAAGGHLPAKNQSNGK